MDGFTIVDLVVAGVIVVSAILAYSRGLVREALAIAAWVAAAVVAFVFAAGAVPLVAEIPWVGDFVGSSCELSLIAAFAIIFALALVLASVFTPLLSGAIQDSALGGADRALGFLYGVARGVLLVAVALVVYDRVAGGEAVASVAESRTATVFERARDGIDAAIPDDAPGWIVARYEELVSDCAL